ncbi:FAD-dependent oxidoreductase, partial [Georgenia soli]|uniref:FAD-dependent oxidoreductase n=1 Tax=Georgenia soli TaxID=638953 RepID=UPI003CCBD273
MRTGHRVTSVDGGAREVTVRTAERTYRLPYDALVLAPGATAVRPPVEGLDHP